MVTSIYLNRYWLITKETMESYCKGEEFEKFSVNDDLESLFENIQLGKEPNENVVTYFLPKLTEEELELVERRDTSYFTTFYFGSDHPYHANTFRIAMMYSESDSKYVYGQCPRRTFVIKNSSKKSLKNKCSLQ